MDEKNNVQDTSVATKKGSEPVWWVEFGWESQLQPLNWWKLKTTSEEGGEHPRTEEKERVFPSPNGFSFWTALQEWQKDPLKALFGGVGSLR